MAERARSRRVVGTTRKRLFQPEDIETLSDISVSSSSEYQPSEEESSDESITDIEVSFNNFHILWLRFVSTRRISSLSNACGIRL